MYNLDSKCVHSEAGGTTSIKAGITFYMAKRWQCEVNTQDSSLNSG